MTGSLIGSAHPAHSAGRRACLAALCLMVASCTPVGPSAQTPSTALPRDAAQLAMPARIAANALIAADGAGLPLREWLPKGEPRAVILALHGFNDYSNAFASPAALWTARGIATYSYDQRGFGGAPGRSFWAGSAQLAADAVTATRLLRRLYPGRPIYLFGESMGGAVAILAATGIDGVPPADADGVILAAPAVWGREVMPLGPQLALWAAIRLFPEEVMTGRGLDIKPSDNLAMLRAQAKDPMVIKGARVAALYGVVDLMDAALAAAPRLAAPLLLLYGAHDQIIPREAVASFAAHLPPDPGRRRRLAFYPQGYHMLTRDLDGATVTGDVATWVLDRSAPLPSQADRTAAMRPWPPEDKGPGLTAAQAEPLASPGLASSGARR